MDAWYEPNMFVMQDVMIDICMIYAKYDNELCDVIFYMWCMTWSIMQDTMVYANMTWDYDMWCDMIHGLCANPYVMQDEINNAMHVEKYMMYMDYVLPICDAGWDE